WYEKDYMIYNVHSDLFKAFRKKYLKGRLFSETRYFNKKKLPKSELEKLVKTYKERYDKIYKEVKKNGFKKPSVFDTIDPFIVSIGSCGEFLFMTGKHRLAIARLMGEDYKIPVKISHRHAEWQQYRDQLYLAYKSGMITKDDIGNKHHPDLFDLFEE